MDKFQIESIRTGVSGGGYACGPVSGNTVAEVCYADAAGTRHWRCAVDCAGTLNFIDSDGSIFESQIEDEWTAGEDGEVARAYDSSYDFYTDLPDRDPDEAELDLLLVCLIYCDEDTAAALIDTAVGSMIGSFSIPVSEDEAGMYEDMEEGEADEAFLLQRIGILFRGGYDPAIDQLLECFDEELDIADDVFRMAIRMGVTDYVREHAEEFILNDYDEGSSYISETEDPDIRQMLIDAGGNPSFDDYEDCRFYYNSVTEDVAVDDDIYEEAAAKVFELTGLTRMQFIAALHDEGACEDCLPEPLQDYDFLTVQAFLDIDPTLSEDIDLPNFTWDEFADFLGRLGYDVEEEGSYDPHGHGSWSVTYIR